MPGCLTYPCQDLQRTNQTRPVTGVPPLIPNPRPCFTTSVKLTHTYSELCLWRASVNSESHISGHWGEGGGGEGELALDFALALLCKANFRLTRLRHVSMCFRTFPFCLASATLSRMGSSSEQLDSPLVHRPTDHVQCVHYSTRMGAIQPIPREHHKSWTCMLDMQAGDTN